MLLVQYDVESSHAACSTRQTGSVNTTTEGVKAFNSPKHCEAEIMIEDKT